MNCFRHRHPNSVPVHFDGLHHDVLRPVSPARRAKVPEGVQGPLQSGLVHLADSGGDLDNRSIQVQGVLSPSLALCCT